MLREEIIPLWDLNLRWCGGCDGCDPKSALLCCTRLLLSYSPVPARAGQDVLHWGHWEPVVVNRNLLPYRLLIPMGSASHRH